MKQIINEVRKNQPLIHHITNTVVINFTANGLLAFGGSPIMAEAKEEAADVASLSSGVLLNIGTLTETQVEAMIKAGKAANEKQVPVVLDPVGVGATKFRSESVQRIINEVQPTVIKGNAGELAHLVDIPLETKGVDSIGIGNTKEIAEKVAEQYNVLALLTGEMDIVSDGIKTITNETGHEWLSKITGAGCLLGSVLAACLSVPGAHMEKTIAAVKFYGLAAEAAARHSAVNGSGSFAPHFIDALSLDLGESL